MSEKCSQGSPTSPTSGAKWSNNRPNNRYQQGHYNKNTAINRAIITKTYTSSLVDQNTVSHHTQGAPTRYAITEAKTFTVSAVQRYDSYPGHKYRDSERKKIYG